MKYFIDTEFIEGTQRTLFGYTKPTIDLISIGIVCEDGREYYSISKDFNLKEAWNRFQRKEQTMFEKQNAFKGKKEYWIRDNVLKSIYTELEKKEIDNYKGFTDPIYDLELSFNYSCLKRLINKYGKSNKQIAEEIIEFCGKHLLDNSLKDKQGNTINQIEADATPKEFYGYYSDYDWVVFCWLFGRMIDLPKGFPKYCIDLKQILNDKVNKLHRNDFFTAFDFTGKDNTDISLEDKLVHITKHVSYPKQTNEHNARSDAKWNKQLYEFLNTL